MAYVQLKAGTRRARSQSGTSTPRRCSSQELRRAARSECSAQSGDPASSLASGTILVVFGVLLATGQLVRLTTDLARFTGLAL